MEQTKDTIANIATIAGPGGMVLGWNETLTLLLILTGIALNVIRIWEIRHRKNKE